MWALFYICCLTPALITTFVLGNLLYQTHHQLRRNA